MADNKAAVAEYYEKMMISMKLGENNTDPAFVTVALQSHLRGVIACYERLTGDSWSSLMEEYKEYCKDDE